MRVNGQNMLNISTYKKNCSFMDRQRSLKPYIIHSAHEKSINSSQSVQASNPSLWGRAAVITECIAEQEQLLHL